MKYFIFYLISINLVSFLTMGIDKYKAKKGYWRIPEKTLFILAVIGGSVGVMSGMRVFHHKTLHWQFCYAIPLIVALQLVLFFAYYYRNFLNF